MPYTVRMEDIPAPGAARVDGSLVKTAAALIALAAAGGVLYGWYVWYPQYAANAVVAAKVKTLSQLPQNTAMSGKTAVDRAAILDRLNANHAAAVH